jgi:hypothetical protein
MTCRNHPGGSRSTVALSRLLAAGALAPVAAVAMFAAAPVRAGLDVPSLGDPTAGRLVGRVHAGKAPLPAANVYVYDVADSSKLLATTDRFGRYAFQPLPAGIYRVIAHRPGYVPAVAELTRTTGESVQSLDFELGTRARRSGEDDEEDFWSVRARIPSDVLRQIQIAEAIADDSGWALETAIQRERFEAELRTLSGIEEAGQAGALVLGSQIDLRSRFGETQLALRSDLREFKRQAFRADAAQQPVGDSQAFALDVNHRGSNIQFTSQRHRFQGPRAGAWDERDPAAGGLESYGVRLEQAAGGGASHFEARYTADNNFHHGFGDLYAGPSGVHSRALAAINSPMSSTTLEFRGAYERQITASTSLETGISYRERQAYGDGPLSSWGEDPHQRFDVFGQGDWEIQPTVVLEYGMFSTLSDGSLSFTPQAGFVVELGPHWLASVAASQRVDSEQFLFRDFLPVQYQDDETCSTTYEHCYRVKLSRRLGASGQDRGVEFGVNRRQFADNVRLYFSRDVFDRLESLLLVDGDQVEEIQFGLQQRLGEKILTRVSSAAAVGGGGLLRAKDGSGLRNDVRYLVASADTRFERSSTGVLVAYRWVEQELSPVTHDVADFRPARADTVLAVERIQLVLTQDLPWVTGLQNWALQLEMQLSRGHVPIDSSHDPDQLRRRVVAGIAVRF